MHTTQTHIDNDHGYQTHTHTQSHGHIPSSSNLKLNFRKSLRTWTLILCLIKQKSLEVIFTIISSDELTQWPKANTAMRIPSNNNNNTHKCVVRYLFIFCLPSPFMSYGAICSYAKRRSTARIFVATIRMKLHCVCVCVVCRGCGCTPSDLMHTVCSWMHGNKTQIKITNQYTAWVDFAVHLRQKKKHTQRHCQRVIT